MNQKNQVHVAVKGKCNLNQAKRTYTYMALIVFAEKIFTVKTQIQCVMFNFSKWMYHLFCSVSSHGKV